MQWYNEPREWTDDGDRVVVDVDADTDSWRVTLHDFVADSAHFYFTEVTGDFTATVEVAGEYDARCDQAGLMLREDEEVWMKCGIEYYDGIQQASTVITREFSDWSIAPLDNDPDSAWIRVERTGPAVEVLFSRDGDEFSTIRQGYLTDAETVQVGINAAAPHGDGFTATFEHFEVESETHD